MNIKEVQLTDENRYGKLLTPDMKIHRKYFQEMVRLIGIKVVYYAPRTDKHYTIHGELFSNYQEPEVIGCIFEDHPTQQSLKKMGWVAELQDDASMIHVDYDLHDLQAGALFAIPSGLDHTKGRLFRVTRLMNSVVYPASISCEIVPEYEDTLPESKLNRQAQDFSLIAQEDDHVF